ncbi:uncharacterized protein LOC127831903 isoform X2 [Dreissena polymorpha]|uniref:uncharacterized protein LOC127831903 isoform X2 n=1 Tax=Dreissena polymorpha TaxID=45954 RepID=UPI002264D236|nr:uncharacterized protein LOC127831903 isoform X2 [Dreissena polymorpha]
MGSGGSKAKTVKIKEIEDTTKSDKRRKSNLSNRESELPRTPEHRKPPKGIRRPSPHRHNRGSGSAPPAENFVPYEAEDLSLTGDWELEKSIDNETPLEDIAYPAPRPGNPAADRNELQKVDFEVIKIFRSLVRASNYCTLSHTNPISPKGTFMGVAMALTAPHDLDIARVRALVTWLGCQKIRSRQYGSDTKKGTVLGYMKQIKDLQGTFAGLLTLLCRSVNIPCVIVKGIYRSSNHRVGEDDVTESRCTWCAVYMDGAWQLVHPYLMCTPLSTKSPSDDWKLIESTKSEVPPTKGTILNNFFFVPKPSDFILFCFPDEKKWQLLEDAIPYQKFIKSPFLRSAFYESGMQLKTTASSILKSEGGKCTIKIQCTQENANKTVLMYDLFSLDLELKWGPDEGRVVLCGRNEDTWNVQVKFPVEGTYKLSLFALIDDSWFFWIGDFKIVCEDPYHNFVPAPFVPDDVGYGPSTLSERAGLLCPSHEGGIVFYKPKETHVIKFLVVEKIVLRYALEHSKYSTASLAHHCRLTKHKGEVDLAVTLPLPGQFALRVLKGNAHGDFENVINYLFTSEDDGRSRENVFQRKARWNLREASAGRNVIALEGALAKFTSVKLEPDDDHLRGSRRLRYLKLKKGLRDGRMRRHEDTLAKAVDEAEMSTFRVALRHNIDKAKALLATLQDIEITCHSVLNLEQKTISEIANFASPPKDVHFTMIATYLLLGEKKQHLKKWGNIQTLLRRQGKESIKNRINNFAETPAPDKSTVKRAQKFHDAVPKPYIVSASLAAAAFYDWVSEVLSHLNNCSLNATDGDDSVESQDLDLSESVYLGNKDDENPGNSPRDKAFLDA